MPTRRALLQMSAATGAMTIWDAPLRWAFADLPTDRRLVVVVLRGALDGLAAVPPHGDKDYADVRGALALPMQGPQALHDLDGFFGLHPALTNLKTLYDARQLIVFHNICSPYRDRSHFDGQNVLESGGARPHLLDDGWLNRALKPMGFVGAGAAVAIAPTPSLLLSGAAPATSWMPAVLPEPDPNFLARVSALYAGDPALSSALTSALDLQTKAQSAMDDTVGPGKKGANRYGNLTPLFSGAGHLLADEQGPRVAVLDAGGWDTHFNEGAADGQLARRLQMLDQALDAMKAALDRAWDKTAIVMATEFGRTVRPNGSGGTDHGTAGAAFLLGGAVAGGMVKAEWTGLMPSALQDGRDQPPRTDLRALLKGVLAEHMGVSKTALHTLVFPDSASVSPMTNVIRS